MVESSISSPAELETLEMDRRPPAGAPSKAARLRMQACPGEPFFLADWVDVLMCHLEVDGEALQQATPFPLDRYQGRAFVSLVFFALRNMRPGLGGWFTRLLFRPIATHRFLNVRTYVKPEGEAGIYFIAEWLPNRVSVQLGPRLFGLPYRLGHFRGENRPNVGLLGSEVTEPIYSHTVRYQGAFDPGAPFQPCPPGSLTEWLMERYTAFTHRGRRARYFHVWHPPWLQVPADVDFQSVGLLRANWSWMADARLIGSNYSPGFERIWMGRPRRL